MTGPILATVSEYSVFASFKKCFIKFDRYNQPLHARNSGSWIASICLHIPHSSSFFVLLLEGREGRGLGWNEGGGTAPVGACPTDREWPARDADVPRRHWTEGQLKGWPFALSAESMRQ